MNCTTCGHPVEHHGGADLEFRCWCSCTGFRTPLTITRLGEVEIEETLPDGEVAGALFSDVFLIRGSLDGLYDGNYVKQLGWSDRDDPRTWRALLN